MSSLRRSYDLKLKVTVSLDDEREEDVEQLLRIRVNEMLGRMEHHDDIRIVLLHDFEVREQK